jgi:hypothetical protein|eukprot:COSAG06_NODE_5227_length_3626_cov_2.269067_2_plen_117_part_00
MSIGGLGGAGGEVGPDHTHLTAIWYARVRMRGCPGVVPNPQDIRPCALLFKQERRRQSGMQQQQQQQACPGSVGKADSKRAASASAETSTSTSTSFTQQPNLTSRALAHHLLKVDS